MCHNEAHHLRKALRRPQQHGVQVPHAADALLARHALADLPAHEQLAQHAAAQAGRMDIQVLPLTCSNAIMVGMVARTESESFWSLCYNSIGTTTCTAPYP